MGSGGSDSVLIVPLKLVNFTPLQPAEECETSNHGTVFGKYDECLAIRKNVSAKQVNCITVFPRKASATNHRQSPPRYCLDQRRFTRHRVRER